MPDQVKQLAFKKFTNTEISNGTAANVLTTNATTHYVIKSIEATQGTDSDAIEATATIGLTSGLSAGEFTSLGTVAKANRTGLSGSAIMDANSTLTIRPTAKTITYSDERINQSLHNDNNPRIYAQAVFPSVNGRADTALNSETTIDKTSVTYTGQGYNLNVTPSRNFTVQHTNANGVDLRIQFSSNGNSTSRFEIWNADGTYYGYYSDQYDAPCFDGERYIFWIDRNSAGGGVRVRWYDLDESTTNLLASNTTGGASGSEFWHGQTAQWADSPAINSHSTYNHHWRYFYKNRHTDGRRYLGGWAAGNQNWFQCELPATLTNDSSTTPAPKWLYLSGSSQNTSGQDPFGNNNGSAWNLTSFIVSQYNPTDEAQVQLTYDPEKERYYLWICPQNNYWFLFTYTQNDWDSRPSGNRILNPQNDGHALRMVSTYSAAEVNLSTNIIQAYSSNNAYVPLPSSGVYTDIGNAYPNRDCPTYIDGKNWYFKDDNSGNTTTYRKCVKADMFNETLTNMFPNTSVTATFVTDLFVSFGTPSAATIASRNYTAAPGLKIRVTGIDVDQ